MDPLAKDLIEIISWTVAIGAGVIAAYRALHELKLNRQQRTLELKWKKAKLAKEIVAAYEDKDQFNAAHHLLAWNAREYQLEDGERVRIDSDMVMHALRTKNLKFTKTEKYIRDCMIVYFESISRLEHFIRRDLVDFEDIKFNFAYAVGRMARQRKVVALFLSNYHQDNMASGFLARYDEWKNTPPKT
ncbi:MAG: hypothetical protein AAF564_13445 [Bacteroidota bacterium]